MFSETTTSPCRCPSIGSCADRGLCVFPLATTASHMQVHAPLADQLSCCTSRDGGQGVLSLPPTLPLCTHWRSVWAAWLGGGVPVVTESPQCGAFPWAGMHSKSKSIHAQACLLPCLLLELHTGYYVQNCNLDRCHWGGGGDLFTSFLCFLGSQYPHFQMYGSVDLSDVLLCCVGILLASECLFGCVLGEENKGTAHSTMMLMSLPG